MATVVLAYHMCSTWPYYLCRNPLSISALYMRTREVREGIRLATQRPVFGGVLGRTFGQGSGPNRYIFPYRST